MEIKQASIQFNWKQKMIGDHVVVSKKLYKDAKDFYESKADLDENTEMYRVISQVDSDICEGHLNWGVSILNPVYVNEECNMTRGHFHEDMNCQEYYWCMSGCGYLMLMDENGKCWLEEMKEGSLHLIDGHNAHRLINTSDEPLEVVCCWNNNAGHDYKRVQEHPFPVRVFKKNGKIYFKEQV